MAGARTRTPTPRDVPSCSTGGSGTLRTPLSEPEAEELARTLGALADPVRLRLLSLVAARDEVCSCELEAPLGRSQPTISHHTKVLADAGLIVGERRGRWTWWHAVPERLAAVRDALQTEALLSASKP